jgi:hypothetical protein
VNWFRSEDPDAEVPQYEFRQGPDYRSGSIEDSGYAVAHSANRPRPGKYGGDAPSARPIFKPATMAMAIDPNEVKDAGVQRLLRTTELIVPFNSSKKTKKRLKNKSGVDNTAAFRWA